jgi:hypothetical protein
MHISITTPVVSASKKLLYLKIYRSPNGYSKPLLLLDPYVGFRSETAITYRFGSGIATNL